MWRARTPVAVAVLLLATATFASAQEATRSFDVLAARLQVGQSIWVTAVSGQEVRGRVERVTPDSLVIDGKEVVTFNAREVRLIRARDRDSVKNGMLIGLGVGAAMGTAWCIGAIADDSPDLNAGVECAEGFLVHPALGALIGLGVDAMIPGKKRLIYEAAPSRNESRGTLLLLPYVSRRAAGVTLAVGF